MEHEVEHRGNVQAVAFHPEGRLIATGASLRDDNKLRLFEMVQADASDCLLLAAGVAIIAIGVAVMARRG